MGGPEGRGASVVTMVTSDWLAASAMGRPKGRRPKAAARARRRLAGAGRRHADDSASWRAANSNLAETVRQTQRRLERNEAEKKALQKEEARRGQGEARAGRGRRRPAAERLRPHAGRLEGAGEAGDRQGPLPLRQRSRLAYRPGAGQRARPLAERHHGGGGGLPAGGGTARRPSCSKAAPRSSPTPSWRGHLAPGPAPL